MSFAKIASISLAALMLTTGFAAADPFAGIGGLDIPTNQAELFEQQGISTPDKEPIHIQFPNVGDNQPQIDPGTIHFPNTGGTGNTGGNNNGNGGFHPDVNFSVYVEAGGSYEAALACEGAGSGDIRVINVGDGTLPAGTKVRWQMDGERGFAVLNSQMRPGTSAKVRDVLAYDSDEFCQARVI